VARAHILSATEIISTDVLPQELSPSLAESPGAVRIAHADTSRSLAEVRAIAVAAAERGYLCALFERYTGRFNDSAKLAGIPARQLRKLLETRPAQRAVQTLDVATTRIEPLAASRARALSGSSAFLKLRPHAPERNRRDRSSRRGSCRTAPAVPVCSAE